MKRQQRKNQRPPDAHFPWVPLCDHTDRCPEPQSLLILSLSCWIRDGSQSELLSPKSTFINSLDQWIADVKKTGSFKITKNLSGKFQPGKSPVGYNMRGTITVMVWSAFGFGSVNSYRTSDSRQYRWRRQIDVFLKHWRKFFFIWYDMFFLFVLSSSQSIRDETTGCHYCCFILSFCP